MTTIGKVANKLGIPASTIRYYERIGLIERQRRVSGRRDFDERAHFALKFIKLAQAAGFSIAEIKVLLEKFSSESGPSGFWQPFAQNKRADVRRQINELRQMESMLSSMLSCRCETWPECFEQARSMDATKHNCETKRALR